ncbi:MAG: hypothetical protein GTO02_20225 [Candidatus Dadabacteria bacterium]|nr:hypothetical protein [Candidatus Dadabacteria bacterium]NIQ16624.1 hypothetical protein [Candidatus Dadabacteria bacterium]
MKTLLLASILGLSFSFSALAGNNIFGVDTPVKKNIVNSNVNAGYVAKDSSDTFFPQRLSNSSNATISSYNNDRYVIFGIDLESNNLL